MVKPKKSNPHDLSIEDVWGFQIDNEKCIDSKIITNPNERCNIFLLDLPENTYSFLCSPTETEGVRYWIRHVLGQNSIVLEKKIIGMVAYYTNKNNQLCKQFVEPEKQDLFNEWLKIKDYQLFKIEEIQNYNAILAQVVEK